MQLEPWVVFQYEAGPVHKDRLGWRAGFSLPRLSFCGLGWPYSQPGLAPVSPPRQGSPLTVVHLQS